MKIIHLKGFTDEERLSYRDIIHSNVIMAMRSIINASEKLEVAIKDENKVKDFLSLHFFFVIFLTFLNKLLIFILFFFRNWLICLQQMKFYLSKG